MTKGNLSVKKEDTYTTTLTNPDGSTTVINNNELGSSGLMTIITDTMSDKTASGSEVNDGLLQQILTSDNHDSRRRHSLQHFNCHFFLTIGTNI